MSLAQRGPNVLDVLIHLRGYGDVERTVRKLQGADIAAAELDSRGVPQMLAAARKLEHARADVDAADETRGPDCRSHLVGQVTGATAQVEHPFTHLQVEQAKERASLLDDIRRGVNRLDRARGFRVEIQCVCHAGANLVVVRRDVKARVGGSRSCRHGRSPRSMVSPIALGS